MLRSPLRAKIIEWLPFKDDDIDIPIDLQPLDDIEKLNDKIKFLNDFIEENNNAMAYYVRANYLLGQEQVDKAAEDIKKANTLGLDTYLLESSIDTYHGNFSEAYKKIKLVPNYKLKPLYIYLLLELELFDAEDYQIDNIDGFNSDCLMYIAEIKRQSGDLQAAMDFTKISLELDSGQGWAHTIRAEIKRQKGLFKESIKEVSRVGFSKFQKK